VIFVATKEVGQQFYFPLLFGIRDPGAEMDKNQNQGSGINIPEPQHWFLRHFTFRMSKKVVLRPVCSVLFALMLPAPLRRVDKLLFSFEIEKIFLYVQ
jgi:hypothetical protein